jgi:hypothetical protein
MTAKPSEQEDINRLFETSPDEALDAVLRHSVARFDGLAQYAGFFDGWTGVRVDKRMKSRFGEVWFKKGDVTIMVTRPVVGLGHVARIYSVREAEIVACDPSKKPPFSPV